jgi:uncharacterized protein YjbI with pentapeptide repeats
MTIADNKSINVNFDIPVSVDQVWFFGSLIALGAILVAVLFVRNKWAENKKRSWRLHEKQMVNAVYWAGWILSPLWLLLIGLTIRGLFSLWFSTPDESSIGEVAMRLHYLALAGLTTVLAGLIGAPLAILRVHTVERQTKAQEEGLITDRINKAVEGLGAEKIIKRTQIQDRPAPASDTQTMTLGSKWPASSVKLDYGVEALSHEQTVPNIEVRIGAIYALERIAKHNLDEHIQIMEILCAYVRENAPIKKQNPQKERYAKPRSDVQTALTVIGRRTEKQRNVESSPNVMWPTVHDSDVIRETGAGKNKVTKFSAALLERLNLGVAPLALSKHFNLDFSLCELAGVDFSEGNFANTNFRGSNLSGAQLMGANLQNCDFWDAVLKDAHLSFADMSGSRMWDANLCAARLVHTRLHCVEFWDTIFDEKVDITDATFYLATFREVNLSLVEISNHQIEASFGDDQTRLNILTLKPRHWGCPESDRLEFLKETKIWAADPLNYQSGG